MTFEDYWAEVEQLRVLPGMAIKQLPSSLSIETKKKLMKKQPEETAEILRAAIEEVNRGSIESIDRLIRKNTVTKRWKNSFALVILATSIALVLWITLFSRIGSDARNVYPPLWSYRAIASGSLRILFEVISNVVLFIPIGMIAALIFHFNIWQTITLGFSISLFIECSQWFLWLGAFEIDDLIHNTFGAAVGAILVERTGLTEKIHFSEENKKKQLVAILSTVIILLSVPFAFQGINYQAMKNYAALNDRVDGVKICWF